MRRVTIKDIAREAGVSPQTVSRAINNKGEIHPQTRERILKIAERLGYRPNSVARSLATQRTYNIGLVVTDVSNPFFAEVSRGIQDTALKAGYNVFLCNTDEHRQREQSAIQSLEAQCVDGLILCSSRLSLHELDKLSDRYQPLVLVNRLLEHKRTGCVLVDDFGGAQKAVRHLIELGHKAIGFMAGPPNSHSGQERLRGYLKEMQDYGITPPERWYVHCTPQADGGREAAERLLTQSPELTALLGYNDLVATGALRASEGMGRVIPETLSIIGYDDVPLAGLLSPALTTVHIAKHELGQQATALLLDMMQHPDRSLDPVVLETHLFIRGTTAAAPTFARDTALESELNMQAAHRAPLT